MTNLSKVKTLTISKQIIEQTYNHFRKYGKKGLEGFVLWNGRLSSEEIASVTEAFIPPQHSVNNTYGLSVTIPGEALHKLNIHLHESNLKLLAQVHSHPNEAYHSAVDDVFPVATQVGSFSLVIPYFGALPFSSDHCAVYRLNTANRWESLTSAQVDKFIIIKDTK